MTDAVAPKVRRSPVGVRALVALLVTLAGFGLAALYAPEGAYLWIKSLHILAVISWMAGLLYLPRLFINHVGLASGSTESQMLAGMEQRLLRIIMTPAMVLTWVAGLWLAWEGFQFHGAWLHAKIACVILMTGAHIFFAQAVSRFARDDNRYSSRFWRIANEVPALLMIAIVILVVVKPF